MNGVYGGSKAYVLAFSHSLQHELASKGIRVQAVLPGATATDFWDAGRLPVHNLPSSMVMTTENLVDAALSGLDQGELVTIPALPDKEEWGAEIHGRGISHWPLICTLYFAPWSIPQIARNLQPPRPALDNQKSALNLMP